MAQKVENKGSQSGVLELGSGTEFQILRLNDEGELVPQCTVFTKGANRTVTYRDPLSGITKSGTLTGTEQFRLVEEKQKEAPKLTLVPA